MNMESNYRIYFTLEYTTILKWDVHGRNIGCYHRKCLASVLHLFTSDVIALPPTRLSTSILHCTFRAPGPLRLSSLWIALVHSFAFTIS